jgi:hypothetical protein
MITLVDLGGMAIEQLAKFKAESKYIVSCDFNPISYQEL